MTKTSFLRHPLPQQTKSKNKMGHKLNNPHSKIRQKH